MNKADFDVIIVGAGPAGLTAAYYLSINSNLRILVLESDPDYVGGISRTVRYKGYRFDIGGHRFFSKSEEINKVWDQLLPDGFVDRPRKSRIYYDGKFFDYPLDAKQALRNLGLTTSAKCAVSYLYARMRPIRNPKNFTEWVSNEFGEKLFNIFFKTYTEKVWGIPCDEISADWASQRIKGLNLFAAVRDSLADQFPALKRGDDGEEVKSLIKSFKYPRLGPGMMWEAATEKLRQSGVEVRMGIAATGFEHNGEHWTVATRDQRGHRNNCSARHVISTAAMRETVMAVRPAAASAGAAKRLQYRDFLTVILILDRPPDFDDNWVYIHEPAVNVGRIQNFGSWSPDLLADQTRGCLGLEYFCNEGDSLWSLPDDELVKLAYKELEATGLRGSAHMIDAAVVRQPKAYPVYDSQYQQIVETIRNEFRERFPGFHFAGRNGMHKYNNQDHAMMTGILVAENIMAGRRKFNVWEVNSDAGYHEHGSEDRAKALSSLRLTPKRVEP